ncbi:MAG TPA: hypothetical protein VF535_09950 [Allosphingosinicella sp.]|jgi:hypothetical protein
MAWGIDNEEWHDEIDCSLLEQFEYGGIPDDRFIMTTWHEDLDETLWFAQFCASNSYDGVELTSTLLVHVIAAPVRDEMLTRFRAATDWEG